MASSSHGAAQRRAALGQCVCVHQRPEGREARGKPANELGGGEAYGGGWLDAVRKGASAQRGTWRRGGEAGVKPRLEREVQLEWRPAARRNLSSDHAHGLVTGGARLREPPSINAD